MDSAASTSKNWRNIPFTMTPALSLTPSLVSTSTSCFVSMYILIIYCPSGILKGYIKTQSYSIGSMEQREAEIRSKAEQLVANELSFHRRLIFNWVLYHARRGVRHRENLRFARTKLFGIFRGLFRAIGDNLVDLGMLKERQDVFYLTVEEIYAFVEGRSVTNNILGLVELRRQEYDGYKKVKEGSVCEQIVCIACLSVSA